MMLNKLIPVSTLLALVPFALIGCDHHEDDPGDSGDHHHEGRYAGELIELDDHNVWVEVVFKPEYGSLGAYVWTGHADEALNIAQAAMDVDLEAGERSIQLKLLPQSDPITGAKPGDTNYFLGQTDDLKGVEAFRGTIKVIEAFGTHENISISYPHD